MNLFKICTTLLVIIWFLGLGYRDLVEPDEARYAEIPREMVQTGDWITPRLNDLKYFEKPALQYWVTAISFKLFGQSNATARLWIAFASLACAAFIGFLGARLYGADVGRYAFMLTASGLLFCVLGHYLTLDMTLTLFTTLGIGCPILALSQRDNPSVSRNWMLAGWAALAGAVLTKGLVGIVLPGLALFLYTLWQRNWQLLKELHIGKGSLLFLVICAPWFITVSKVNQEFAQFFFIHEHFARYTTDVHERDKPIYYFISIFVVGSIPWLISSSRSLLTPGFSWRANKGEAFNPERFMWLFIVATLVFFSLAHSKLPGYILPIFPFVALLTAKRIANDGFVKGDYWVLLFAAGLFLMLAFVGTRFASEKNPVDLFVMYRPWLLTSALSFGIGAAALFKWRRSPTSAVPVVSVCATLGTMSFLWGFQAIAISRSSADEAKAIELHVDKSTPVYAVGNYPQALPFYLDRTITVVAYSGELTMGIEAEPHKFIDTMEEFWGQWDRDPQAVAVLSTNDIDIFTARTKAFRVIYKGPRRTVVTKY